jgi:WD40 repeat protein
VGANEIVISPDNFVYVTSSSDTEVCIWSRDVDSGALTFLQPQVYKKCECFPHLLLTFFSLTLLLSPLTVSQLSFTQDSKGFVAIVASATVFGALIGEKDLSSGMLSNLYYPFLGDSTEGGIDVSKVGNPNPGLDLIVISKQGTIRRYAFNSSSGDSTLLDFNGLGTLDPVSILPLLPSFLLLLLSYLRRLLIKLPSRPLTLFLYQSLKVGLRSTHVEMRSTPLTG